MDNDLSQEDRQEVVASGQQNLRQREMTLVPVLDFARESHYEERHSHQVARLSVRLFDELVELHQLGERDRVLLESSALLHDIGWSGGRQGHHKRSRDMIMAEKRLPFDENERVIVALVARYHRRSFPDKKHKYFAELNEYDKRRVKFLSSLLRLSDGLDRTHGSAITDLTCRIFPAKTILKIQAPYYSLEDCETAKKKADLFEAIFAREIVLDWEE